MKDTGYVTDIEYPRYYHSGMNPSVMAFACGLQGFEAGAFEEPFNYLELGGGAGTTANVLAALYPHGQFYCVDFNPQHVAEGRQLAAAAGLGNLTMIEASFEDMASGRMALPQFDWITMHGVYSWVNAEQKRHIRTIIKHHATDSGMVQVNYNAMPGWAAAVPLQRIILDYAGGLGVPRDQQVVGVRQWVKRLADANAKFFVNHAKPLEVNLSSIAEHDAGYVAHEYLDRGWEPLYHSDVAREFGEIGFQFVTSATKIMADVSRPPEQRALLREISEPTLRETVKDLLDNTAFRQDIFVRGDARRLSPAERSAWTYAVGLCLIKPRAAVTEIPTDSPLAPVLEALVPGPLTFTELARASGMPHMTGPQMMMVASALWMMEAVVPYVSESVGTDPARAIRANRAFCSQARTRPGRYALVSPQMGIAVSVNALQQYVYEAVVDGEEAPSLIADAFLAYVDHHTARGQVIAGAAGTLTRDEILASIADIEHNHVPIWRRLGLL